MIKKSDKYILDTDCFKFSFTAELCEKDSYYANSLLNVDVECDGFKAATVMEICWQDIVNFSKDLYHLYRTLNGKATIKELYSDNNFIEFSSDLFGHISVKGMMYNFDNCRKKELYFENEFDQTYLKDFATKLYNEFVV